MSNKPTKLSNIQKLEILKIELCLLQSRFDKYDDLFFRNRQISVTITVAGIGAAITANKPLLLFILPLANIFFLFLELFNRLVFFRKIVERHELIRAVLNGKLSLDEFIVYDPFNDLQLKLPKRQNIIYLSYIETLSFYGTVIILPILIEKIL